MECSNSGGCNVMKYTKALIRMWSGISAAQLLSSYKVKPNLTDPSTWSLIYKCSAPFGGSCPNCWSKAERNQIMMNYCWDMIDVFCLKLTEHALMCNSLLFQVFLNVCSLGQLSFGNSTPSPTYYLLCNKRESCLIL